MPELKTVETLIPNEAYSLNSIYSVLDNNDLLESSFQSSPNETINFQPDIAEDEIADIQMESIANFTSTNNVSITEADGISSESEV